MGKDVTVIEAAFEKWWTEQGENLSKKMALQAFFSGAKAGTNHKLQIISDEEPHG